MPELGSTTASMATSEAALRAAVGIEDALFRSVKVEVQGSCHRRH